MNKSGLLLRLAVTIGFAAVFIGFISSQFFYKLSYQSDLNKLDEQIQQLIEIVLPTSSIAAYLNDKELAKEVVNGLASNNKIIAASFKTNDFTVNSADIDVDASLSHYPIYSPFIRDDKLGEITVQHDIEHIEKISKESALFVSNSMLLQALFVTGVAIFIAYYFITRPMLVIAKTLHLLTPGTARRLKKPSFHQQSELGNLVADINTLLARTETQLKQERELRSEIEILEKRFRLLFENSLSPIILTEPRGNILIYNQAFNHLINKIEQPYQKNFGPLLAELFEKPDVLQELVKTAFLNDEIAIGEFKLAHLFENQTIWVQVVVSNIVTDDMKSYYQITLNDISKKREELELLSKRADFDALTNLANRSFTEKHCEQLMARNMPFSFFLMDLNGFKQINDIYGHEAGDEILINVAKQMKQALPETALACRWGGDEFVIVTELTDQKELTALFEQIISRIKKPYILMSKQVQVSIGACVGAAQYPTDSMDFPTLVNLADQAMYKIKVTSKQEGGQYLQFALNESDNNEAS